MTAPTILCCSVVILVLACTQLQTEAAKSLLDIYNTLSTGDRQTLGQVMGPQFKRKFVDPNFLRFGKRSPNILIGNQHDPNFLRFGKRSDSRNNFLRFGRSFNVDDDLTLFERENRKPNFLRKGIYLN